MTRVFAHRGASASTRENTVEAFAAAAEAGADWVELDVRRTADDVLIVHHDAHLDDGRAIVHVTEAELPEYVPNLAEALEACVGMGVNVEIKNDPGDPDYDDAHMVSLAVAGLITAYRPHAELLVSSFNNDSVNRIRAVDPAIPTALVVFDVLSVDQLIERCTFHGHRALNPHSAAVDRSFVEKAHAGGLEVNVWTVNEPERVAELVALGVEGVITDDPAMARRVVDEVAGHREPRQES